MFRAGYIGCMMGLPGLLDRAVARGDVPGATGIVLTRDGVAWSGSAGVRDTSTGAAMTADTVFWIASMTKPLTSIAAMQLVERGLLSLDAPVADVLPQLARPMVLDGVADGLPVLRPARTAMTLRHLLTHTSGYAYWRWDAALNRALKPLGLTPVIRGFDELARMPLIFDPGSRWMYGIGIGVTGRMIEAVTGQTLDRVIEAEICGPLGMTDTTFVLNDEQRGRATPIHVRDKGGWVPSGAVGGRSVAFMAGDGGLYGTAGDYAKLLTELLAGAPRLLSAPGWAAMTGNQIGDLDVQMLRTADAGQSVDLDLAAGQRAKWSLGFMTNPAAMPGRRGAGSQFWAGLANTYFWLDPGAGMAGVLMSSVLPFGYPGAFGLFEAFERAAYAGRGGAG